MKFIKLFESFSKSNYVSTKVEELTDLVFNFSPSNNLIYQWKDDSNNHLIVILNTEDMSIKYEFDIENMLLIKTTDGDIIEYNTTSVDDGFDYIEKDIYKIIGISERLRF
jgi:hypothetical protein